MVSSITIYLEGDIVEEGVQFTLTELSRASGASEELLMLCVAEGALAPRGPAGLRDEVVQWRFEGAALRRARTAQRLTQDLGVNAPGVALALDLLDQIEQLQGRVR